MEEPNMKMTFRWYGSSSGSATSPDKVHAARLDCKIIESVNVYEGIKIGLPAQERREQT